MGNMYGSGAKGRATKLHAELIREKGECENCGDTHALQCAHIISRKYAKTRPDLNNAFCLCASCHMKFTDNPVDFGKFVIDKIGNKNFSKLRKKAYNTTKKMDWEEEYKRLKEIQAQCH